MPAATHVIVMPSGVALRGVNRAVKFVLRRFGIAGITSGFITLNWIEFMAPRFLGMLWLTLYAPLSFGQTEEAIERLRAVQADYSVFGSVAEELYRLQLLEEFNVAEYEILRGLRVESRFGRKIRELDLVVISRATGMVRLAVEVKGGGSKRSIDEAKRQRRVFLKMLSQDEIGRIYVLDNPKITVDPMQFPVDLEFRLVGVAAMRRYGYDDAVPFTREQLEYIHRRLMTKEEVADETAAKTAIDHPANGDVCSPAFAM